MSTMCYPITPQMTCDSILQHIRSTALNFELRETPFSIFLTLRKSFNRNVRVQPYNMHQDDSTKLLEQADEHEILKTEYNALKARNDFLEKSKEVVENAYEEEVNEAENCHKQLTEASEKLDNLQVAFNKMKTNFDNLKIEKKNLEAKNIKSSDELKSQKFDNEELKKSKNKADIALKTVKKEIQESNHLHEKSVKKYETTIEELLEYKVKKSEEEKAERKRQKKKEQKLKKLEKIETIPEQIEQSSDLNSNETHSKLEEPLPEMTFSVPVKNVFEVLSTDTPDKTEVPDYDSNDIFEKEEFANGDHNQNITFPLVEPTTLDCTSVYNTSLLDPIRLNNSSLSHTSLDPNSMIITTLEPTSINHTILDLTSLNNTNLDPTRLNNSS